MTRRKKAVLGMSLAFAGLFGAYGAWHAWTAPEWRTASREPVGLAPDPAAVTEAVVQVYAARAWGWRGYFGVHSWVAVKPSGAPAFTVYEVIGWRLRWNATALTVHQRHADARWFGREPELLVDLRGEGVDALIVRLDQAARAYPYADRYRIWPGPNSNTFTAFLGRAVPELGLDLPPTAIGKDYVEARSSALRREAGCRLPSTGSPASSPGRRRGSRSACSGWCSERTSGRPRSSSRSSAVSAGAAEGREAFPDGVGRYSRAAGSGPRARPPRTLW